MDSYFDGPQTPAPTARDLLNGLFRTSSLDRDVITGIVELYNSQVSQVSQDGGFDMDTFATAIRNHPTLGPLVSDIVSQIAKRLNNGVNADDIIEEQTGVIAVIDDNSSLIMTARSLQVNERLNPELMTFSTEILSVMRLENSDANRFSLMRLVDPYLPQNKPYGYMTTCIAFYKAMLDLRGTLSQVGSIAELPEWLDRKSHMIDFKKYLR